MWLFCNASIHPDAPHAQLLSHPLTRTPAPRAIQTHGYCVIAKRLEAGTFRRVRQADGETTHVEIDAGELAMLLEGIDAPKVRRRKRYRAPDDNRQKDMI